MSDKFTAHLSPPISANTKRTGNIINPTKRSERTSRSRSPILNSHQRHENLSIRKTRSSRKMAPSESGSAETHTKEKLAQTNSLTPRKKSISVGNNYQANVDFGNGQPDQMPIDKCPSRPMDECLWNAHNGLNDEDVKRYCYDANTHFGIESDEALNILYMCAYDLNKSRQELPRHVICEQRFSEDDANSFRNAYMYFGKNFIKVKQMLPHKTMYELIEHYYRTKKQQHYKSFIDTEAIKAREAESSQSDSEEEDESEAAHRHRELHEPICEVCKETVQKLYQVNGLELCRTCKLYFRATNKHRVCSLSMEEELQRRVPKCPADMEQIADQFEELGRLWKPTFEDTDDTGELQVAKKGKTVCQQQIFNMRKDQKQLEVNTRRMAAALLKESAELNNTGRYLHSVDKTAEFLARTAQITNNPTTTNSVNQKRANYAWSRREKKAAMQALVRFNGDCNLVAGILGTKTPELVRAFYKEYEKEIQKNIGEELEKMETKWTAKEKNITKVKIKSPEKVLTSEPEVIELE